MKIFDVLALHGRSSNGDQKYPHKKYAHRKIASKKKFRNANQYLTRTTGPRVQNPNTGAASYKPKQT